MDAHRLSLSLTGGLLTVLLGLGLGLQLGWRRDQARWPHHALYFAVVAGTLLSALLAWRDEARWLALLPAALLLLGMSRTRPGRPAHWRLALVCAVAYAVGAWGAW